MKRYKPEKPILIPMAFFTIVIVAIILCKILCGCQTIEYTMNYLEDNPKIAQEIFDKGVELYQKEKTKRDKNKSKDELDNEDIQIALEDEIAYSELNWVYGGLNGSKAKRDLGFGIKNLRTNATTLFYDWNGGDLYSIDKTDSHDNCAGIACVFFKDESGRWGGGKFDWVSSDRLSRGLQHCWEGYKGWNLNGIPNPCEIAFVIVHKNNGIRTNVIKGTWKR